MDPAKEQILFPEILYALRVRDSGVFRLGKEEVVKGQVRYSTGDALFFPNDTRQQYQ